MTAKPLSIPVPELELDVSGLLDLPVNARAIYVLAHGAGAGMRHPFMEKIATLLAAAGMATLRYQFPYMERGSSRTDPPDKCVATVRAAVAAARAAVPSLLLVAGGKSFGGRMTSTAQSRAPLDGVRGLVFLGFPLHPPGNPGITRAEHLDLVNVPMLFLQGSRDEFARADLLNEVVSRLKSRATLHVVRGPITRSKGPTFRASSPPSPNGPTGALDELLDLENGADRLQLRPPGGGEDGGLGRRRQSRRPEEPPRHGEG